MSVDLTKDPATERAWADRAWYIRRAATDYREWLNMLRRQGGAVPVSLVKR